MEADEAPEELIYVATAAEDVAKGLNKFLPHVPDHDATDITGLIAKCFELSSDLRRLGTLIHRLPGRDLYRFDHIRDGLEDLISSLNYTFDDAHRIVGVGFRDAGKRGMSQRKQYGQVWENLTAWFLDQSGNTLRQRLEYCRRCVIELTNIVREGTPHDAATFGALADRVQLLLSYQRRKMIDERKFLAPEPQQPGIPKPPSFERRRPTDEQLNNPPPAPAPPPRTAPAAHHRAARPHELHPRMEPGWNPLPHRWRPGPPPPPAAPDIPFSPISSTDDYYSTETSSSQSDVEPPHWLTRVFSRPPPYSALEATGESTACFAPHQHGVLEMLEDDGYVNLREIKFESGDVMISFHHNFQKITSRILCETQSPPSSRHHTTTTGKECAVHLYLLDIERAGPFLKLKRLPTKNREGMLWAALRFLNYEMLVMFHCIFLALRSQDQGGQGKKRDDAGDWRLRWEDTVFQCHIPDDHYDHILEIRRDRDSGAVRLLASIAGKEMKFAPVWTAFITHQMHSPRWMQGTGKRVVSLAELQRYIFLDDYVPSGGGGGNGAGGCDLTFNSSQDALMFMDAIDGLVDGSWEGGSKSKGKGKEHGKVKEKEKEKGKDKGKGKERRR